MNGINAPKVVECLGSDGQKYRQLAKSGNDDLRQDAVRVPYCSFFFISILITYRIANEPNCSQTTQNSTR